MSQLTRLRRHGRASIFLVSAIAVWLAGCAGGVEPPVLRPQADGVAESVAMQLKPLLPTDVLLLGEQHDASAHQQIEQQVTALLAARGTLAAVVLEMAYNGASTANLKSSATEQQVKSALGWNDKGWPWASYGPAVMTAVRAGVPVLGGDLPPKLMAASMSDGQLDGKLPGPALKAQQQLIRLGHCNLLPENQITPMTRAQIARDISLANALGGAVLPGKVVLLLSGSGHADRTLGVPQHLRAGISSKSVLMRAGDVTQNGLPDRVASFDSVWPTPALPETDYCEKFRAQTGRQV